MDRIPQIESRFERSQANVMSSNTQPNVVQIAPLTGGGDKPYALGMAAALTSEGLWLDLIGSDDSAGPGAGSDNPRIKFLNLRGSQCPDAGRMAKALRVLKYYGRLIGYAATAKPRIFHILWQNKFAAFDRTLLLGYVQAAW